MLKRLKDYLGISKVSLIFLVFGVKIIIFI